MKEKEVYLQDCLKGKIPVLICKRCEWSWFPRTTQLPKVCPRCKSPYWNKPRIKGIKK